MTVDQLIMACADHYIQAAEIWMDEQGRLLGMDTEEQLELMWKRGG